MDRGLVRLVERQDPALAALLADDRRTARHSTAAGDRYLVVPASSEAASRHDLRDLGSCAISGPARSRVPRGIARRAVHTVAPEPTLALSCSGARSTGTT